MKRAGLQALLLPHNRGLLLDLVMFLRLIYLAEHAEQPKVWWLMLAANAPIILRLVLAS